jgi:hypothetical protein
MTREPGWYWVRWDDVEDAYEPAYWSYDQWERLQGERRHVAEVGPKIEEPKETP